jgi:hypothetical protein
VMVTVVEVDLSRKRIALSMKANPDFGEKRGRTAPTTISRPDAKASGPKTNDWFTEALNKGIKR